MQGSPGHRRSKRGAVAAVAAVLVLVGAAVVSTVLPAGASHPEVSLAGSNFEIDTDANLIANDAAPSIDWASVAETRKADTPSGNSDESFGQGSKEDTAVPSVVDGSIPPNKSDLKFFGVYQEGSTTTGFLNLYWSRVQDPSGTTNMDFEFNKRQCTPGTNDADCSGNGITPLRSVGDMLIIYDLSQGGTHPTLSIRRWTGSAWGPTDDLTASNEATGSINTSPIAGGDSDGLGPHDPRTFGEAQISMAAILGNQCDSFGSAYLKSRSSDAFNAALKDFVPPVPVNIANCGAITVEKVRKHAASGSGDHPHAGVNFTVNGVTKATGADGKVCFDALPLATYTVTETTPTGYQGEAPKSVVVDNAASCSGSGETVKFTNTPLTDITVSVDSQVAGGTASTITCKNSANTTVGSGSTNATTGDGSATASNLLPDTYTCVVVVDP